MKAKMKISPLRKSLLWLRSWRPRQFLRRRTIESEFGRGAQAPPAGQCRGHLTHAGSEQVAEAPARSPKARTHSRSLSTARIPASALRLPSLGIFVPRHHIQIIHSCLNRLKETGYAFGSKLKVSSIDQLEWRRCNHLFGSPKSRFW
jgi:hypothetical protein